MSSFREMFWEAWVSIKNDDRLKKKRCCNVHQPQLPTLLSSKAVKFGSGYHFQNQIGLEHKFCMKLLVRCTDIRLSFWGCTQSSG